METTKEKRDRIFAAADMLFEQAGRASFPTVDAVRRAAKAGMNDASVVMKEWRRLQAGGLEEPAREERAACAAQPEMQQRSAETGAGTEELRAELDRAHEEAMLARAGRDMAQEAAAANSKRAESLLTELAEANTRVAELESEISIRKAGWAESIEGLDRQIKAARQDARDAQSQLRAAVKEARDAVWRLGRAEGELNALQGEVASLRETIRQIAAEGADKQPLVARLWAWAKQSLVQARR